MKKQQQHHGNASPSSPTASQGPYLRRKASWIRSHFESFLVSMVIGKPSLQQQSAANVHASIVSEQSESTTFAPIAVGTKVHTKSMKIPNKDNQDDVQPQKSKSWQYESSKNMQITKPLQRTTSASSIDIARFQEMKEQILKSQETMRVVQRRDAICSPQT